MRFEEALVLLPLSGEQAGRQPLVIVVLGREGGRIDPQQHIAQTLLPPAQELVEVRGDRVVRRAYRQEVELVVGLDEAVDVGVRGETGLPGEVALDQLTKLRRRTACCENLPCRGSFDGLTHGEHVGGLGRGDRTDHRSAARDESEELLGGQS